MGATVLQLCFDGLAIGLVYVILATGLVLVMSVTRIFLIAYGQFYMIGAYAVWYLSARVGAPYWLALILGVLATAALGSASYWLIFKRLVNQEGQFLTTITAALGLYLFLGQAGLLVFGTIPRSIPALFPGILHWHGVTVSVDKLALMALGVAVTVLLFLTYEKTKMGRAMRAVSLRTEAAALQGVNVGAVCILAIAIGAGLAGFAGGIITPSYGISPQMGQNILAYVLLMVMLGGMDSLLGGVLGGLIVGLVLSFGQYFIGGLVQILLFLVILVLVYMRPNGLLGRGTKLEI